MDKPTFCSCWVNYPNKAHLKNNGSWLCVDCYEPIRPLGKYKQKCIKVRSKKDVKAQKEQ